MAITLNGTTGITTPTYGGAVTAEYIAPVTSFKNRIINGAMQIDQRNAGASDTPANGDYTIDRWRVGATQSSKFTVQQNAGSVTPPTGFSNYLGVTSSSSYSVISTDAFSIGQRIEGLNFSDLAWGTANAQTVTLSFWVRSSLTGLFAGNIVNNPLGNRAYPFSYTINASDTWEQKSITIVGDTTGTWLTTNGIGGIVSFVLGLGSTYLGVGDAWNDDLILGATGATSVVGTNGATFYITGVQLEKGSTATSFDYRPYGTELALCQRYYYKVVSLSGQDNGGVGLCRSATSALIANTFPVEMRDRPTALETTGTASNYTVRNSTAGAVSCTSVPAFFSSSTNSAVSDYVVASGLVAGNSTITRSNVTSSYLAWSAEL